MHQYHDQTGALPPAAATAKDGKPLLSWRVLLLPSLKQDELFKQFKLDEPWDSPHNKQLLSRMPSLYAVPGEEKGSDTFFKVFTGEATPFRPGKKTRVPVDFPDSPSYTLLIAATGDPVPWTKPEDLPYDENRPLPRLVGPFPNGFFAVMADGAT